MDLSDHNNLNNANGSSIMEHPPPTPPPPDQAHESGSELSVLQESPPTPSRPDMACDSDSELSVLSNTPTLSSPIFSRETSHSQNSTQNSAPDVEMKMEPESRPRLRLIHTAPEFRPEVADALQRSPTMEPLTPASANASDSSASAAAPRASDNNNSQMTQPPMRRPSAVLTKADIATLKPRKMNKRPASTARSEKAASVAVGGNEKKADGAEQNLDISVEKGMDTNKTLADGQQSSAVSGPPVNMNMKLDDSELGNNLDLMPYIRRKAAPASGALNENALIVSAKNNEAKGPVETAQTMDQPAKISTPKSTPRKCGNCGLTGHIKTSKLCPNFSGTVKSIEAHDEDNIPAAPSTPAPAGRTSTISGTPTSTPKRVLAKCGNCGLSGHMKTNTRLCPKLNGSQNSASADQEGMGNNDALASNTQAVEQHVNEGRVNNEQADIERSPSSQPAHFGASARATWKCGSCGELGHKASEKQCPNYAARSTTRVVKKSQGSSGIKQSEGPSARDKWKCHKCERMGHKSNDTKRCPLLNGGVEYSSGQQLEFAPKKRVASAAEEEESAKKQKVEPQTAASEIENFFKDAESEQSNNRTFRFQSPTPASSSKEPTPAFDKQPTPVSIREDAPASEQPLASRPPPKVFFKKPALPPSSDAVNNRRTKSSPSKHIVYDSDEEPVDVNRRAKTVPLDSNGVKPAEVSRFNKQNTKSHLQVIQDHILEHPPVAAMIEKFEADASKIHTKADPELLVHEHARFALKIFRFGAAPKQWTVGSPGQEAYWVNFDGPPSPFKITDIHYDDADLLLFTELQHIHWMTHATNEVKMVVIRDKNFQARRREMSRDKLLNDKEIEAKGKLEIAIDVHSYSTPLKYRKDVDTWREHGGHGDKIGVEQMLNLWRGSNIDQDGNVEMKDVSDHGADDDDSDYDDEPIKVRSRKAERSERTDRADRNRRGESFDSLFDSPRPSKSPTPQITQSPLKASSRLIPRRTPANHLSISWKSTDRPGGLSKFANTFQDALRYTNYASVPKCGSGKVVGDVGKTMIAADMTGCESWAIMAQAGAVSKAHLDMNGVNTYVTLEGNTLGGVDEEDEDVVKLWPAFPLWRLSIEEQEEAYADFAKTVVTDDWVPEKLLKKMGSIPLIALFRHDTLIMPVGTVHMPITITDSLMIGGMVWNPKHILRTLAFYAFTAVYDQTTNEDATSQARIIVPWLLNEIRNGNIDIRQEAGITTKRMLPKFIVDWMKFREKAILSRVVPCNCESGPDKKKRCQQWECDCLMKGISCDPNYCHLSDEAYEALLDAFPGDQMRLFDWK